MSVRGILDHIGILCPPNHLSILLWTESHLMCEMMPPPESILCRAPLPEPPATLHRTLFCRRPQIRDAQSQILPQIEPLMILARQPAQPMRSHRDSSTQGTTSDAQKPCLGRTTKGKPNEHQQQFIGKAKAEQTQCKGKSKANRKQRKGAKLGKAKAKQRQS